MKKKRIALLLALLTLLLSGCGSMATENGAKADYAYSGVMEPEEAPMEMESIAMDGAASEAKVPEGRKWIVTVEMTAETEDLEALLTTLDTAIADLEGYVEDQNIYNGSSYDSYRYRSARLTVRIPADRVDSFAREVTGAANVVRQNRTREDVTLSYVSTESRVKALQTEEERLLELMEQAETMADLLEIEARLTDVRYELERYSSQLRVYDNRIDYATIYLEIEEVRRYTPVAEQTIWERIGEGFAGTLEDLKEGIEDGVVWIAVNSPYLVIWALVLGAAFLILRQILRRGARKRAARKDQAGENQEK